MNGWMDGWMDGWVHISHANSSTLSHGVLYVTDRLRSLYCRAMQLEVNFFSAQPGTPPHSECGCMLMTIVQQQQQQQRALIVGTSPLHNDCGWHSAIL
jgi:hypothetical protein